MRDMRRRAHRRIVCGWAVRRVPPRRRADRTIDRRRYRRRRTPTCCPQGRRWGSSSSAACSAAAEWAPCTKHTTPGWIGPSRSRSCPPNSCTTGHSAGASRPKRGSIARLEHPNIVPIYASGIDSGVPWMSMRLLTGDSLGALLDRGPARADRGRQVAAERRRGARLCPRSRCRASGHQTREHPARPLRHCVCRGFRSRADEWTRQAR